MSLKLYLITCDLLEAGDHQSFRERLRSLEARQVLNQQWAVRTTYTAAELKNVLRGFLGDRDRIVVTEVARSGPVGGRWWTWGRCECRNPPVHIARPEQRDHRAYAIKR